MTTDDVAPAAAAVPGGERRWIRSGTGFHCDPRGMTSFVATLFSGHRDTNPKFDSHLIFVLCQFRVNSAVSSGSSKVVCQKG